MRRNILDALSRHMWGLRGEAEIWGFWLPRCLFVFVCDHLADSAIRADSCVSVKELLRLR